MTESKEIKHEIREHFRQWTKHNPKDETVWEGWKVRYKPKDKIDNVWYEGVEDKISIEELKTIIEKALKRKVIGPSKVFNEMIKRLGNKLEKRKCVSDSKKEKIFRGFK
ncbi:32598_t:CDS:2 [Gigaspora margarita]|uniref:32598_t:CDS:1 n=1 Tax=Gigaspora margarita TaxID=4874 RepID=A0ABN7W1W2_GIGMA|nr:32598_t:CDS:2 [Gigaspora margarita]